MLDQALLSMRNQLQMSAISDSSTEQQIQQQSGSEEIITLKRLLTCSICFTFLSSDMHPKQCSSMDGLRNAVVHWEGELKEYYEAGGTVLDERTRRLTFLRLMPRQVQENLWWRVHEFPSFELLKEHVLGRVPTEPAGPAPTRRRLARSTAGWLKSARSALRWRRATTRSLSVCTARFRRTESCTW